MKQKILLPVLVLSALFLLGPTGDTVYEGATEGGGGGGTATSLSLSPAPALCTGVDFPKGITATGDAASCAAIADTDLPAVVRLDTEAPFFTYSITIADPNTGPQDCLHAQHYWVYENTVTDKVQHWACVDPVLDEWVRIDRVQHMQKFGAVWYNNTANCKILGLPTVGTIGCDGGSPTSGMSVNSWDHKLAYSSPQTLLSAECSCVGAWTGVDAGDSIDILVVSHPNNPGSTGTIEHTYNVTKTVLDACASGTVRKWTVDYNNLTLSNASGFWGLTMNDNTDTGTAIGHYSLACVVRYSE